MTDPWMTPPEAAEALRIHPRTLREWRYKKRGPKWYKISPRVVRYSRNSVEMWVFAREFGERIKPLMKHKIAAPDAPWVPGIIRTKTITREEVVALMDEGAQNEN